METAGSKKKNKRGRRSRGGINNTGAVVGHRAFDDHIHTEKIAESSKNKSKKLRYDEEYSSNKEMRSQNLNKQVGVRSIFDFPWLKEEGKGVMTFKGDGFCEPAGLGLGMGMLPLKEDEYHPTFGLFYQYDSSDNAHFTTNISDTTFSHLPLFHRHHLNSDQVVTLQDKAAPISSSNNKGGGAGAGAGYRDQQQMDYCIWSSVLDQPLDINLNII